MLCEAVVPAPSSLAGSDVPSSLTAASISCLQKVMGKIYVTDLDNLRSAMALVGSFAFYAGEPDKELVLHDIKRNVIMIPQNKSWESLIESSLPATKMIRYGIKKTPRFNQEKLKQACATVLGLDVFDETSFRENMDFISVPARNVLEFHLKDGRIVTTELPRTSPKECWTPEYRAMMCEKRRQKSYCKGATVLTNKIRCTHCGCNFRRCSSTSAGGKAHHWRCADHNGCGIKGFREDWLKAFIAETLGLPEFDDAVFDAQIDHIDVISETNMVFCFKDGRMISRAWERPKRVNMPWTDERRRKVSERMTQLRKERKVWRKEK